MSDDPASLDADADATVPHAAGDPVSIDGRTLRARRTRTAVVDALLALVVEGDLRPTGPRIAERAGVSLRSVFQHFDDLEALFAVATERQTERIFSLITPLPGDGPRAERLDAFLDERVRVLDAITPVRLSARLQEPFSATLRAGRDKMIDLSRVEIAHVFGPELAAVSAYPARCADLLEALVAAATWNTWEALHLLQRLPVEDARRVMRHTISALLATTDR